MDERRSVEGQIEDLANEAAALAQDAGDTAGGIADDVAQGSSSLENSLSDIIESLRRAITQQPITSMLLVGAFAFLWGLNRRR
jgi:hypothetical protein